MKVSQIFVLFFVSSLATLFTLSDAGLLSSLRALLGVPPRRKPLVKPPSVQVPINSEEEVVSEEETFDWENDDIPEYGSGEPDENEYSDGPYYDEPIDDEF